jgi:hypothetical protein
MHCCIALVHSIQRSNSPKHPTDKSTTTACTAGHQHSCDKYTDHASAVIGELFQFQLLLLRTTV